MDIWTLERIQQFYNVVIVGYLQSCESWQTCECIRWYATQMIVIE